MTAARRLIVNADDFGMSRSVNRGILDSHTRGIVTRTSIMATGAAFSDAVALARNTPTLAIGVHLNYYRGTPLLSAERIPSLVGPDGLLLGSWKQIVRRLSTGRLSLGEVEAEFAAQIEKVIEAGLAPAHLNSDKHLHLWPSVFDVTCRLAARFGIPEVRVVREPLGMHTIPMGLSALSVRNARVALAHGLRFADRTIGVTEQATDLLHLERILKHARHQTTELIVHPGYIDDEFMEMQRSLPNKLVESRRAEVATLTDPTAAALVTRAGLVLVNEA